MIFYFSGTGNSKYVAEKIAEKTGDRVISMSDCLKKMHFDFQLKKGERLGFVYPVYYWGLPSVVKDFAKKFCVEKYGKHYSFSVATCGVATGSAEEDLAKILAKRGIGLHATFAVKMVDNYTLVFDVKNKEKNAEINANAKESIENIAFLVGNRTAGYHNHFRSLWMASPVAHVAYEMSRGTSHFKVSEDCIGCGVCLKNCPTDAISLDYGKPIWVNKKCAMCFSCLHRCPGNAISFTALTKRNGQYTFSENGE